MRPTCILILVLAATAESLEQKDESSNNLKVCIVEGKGLYKKAGRYCPILEKSEAKVECVIGLDRLDCLRRISKGTVDFSVFSSEDLLAASWADIDVLVTDELRFHQDPFEYEIVAIVENNIETIEDLRGSRLCHPGYGYEADWTDTLANFFESKIVTRRCDPNLSLMENKVRASAEFFIAACKAGPWVPDKIRDRTLKNLYPSLCSLCYDSQLCSSSDKYWGRRGPLHCLTEEIGNVAWVRLDDVMVHFSLKGNIGLANPSKFSYMCSDGTKRPLRNTTTPCVWLAKPWPVIAAKRKRAAAVSQITQQLSHDDPNSWKSALLSLIEFYHVDVYPLRPQIPVQDYLQRAIGFQSANSFAECNPPRSVTMCTTDIVGRHKCDWLAEIARASGIEPELECVSEINNDNEALPEMACFESVKNGRAEFTVAHPDWQTIVKRDYNLEPILFETTLIMNDLYMVAAVVKNSSSIKTIKDLKGKSACFPRHEGVAWNSVMHFLKSQNHFTNTKCSLEEEMEAFFDGICAPGISEDSKFSKTCKSHSHYFGEVGALKCLVDEVADVAFISLRTLHNVTEAKGVEILPHNFNVSDYRVVCPPTNTKNCYISWSSIGQVYINSKTSDVRRQELINLIKQFDQNFGRSFKSPTTPFTMYGPFDRKHNVVFQDRTKYLKTFSEISETRLMYNYEVVAKDMQPSNCTENSSVGVHSFSLVSLVLLALLVVSR